MKNKKALLLISSFLLVIAFTSSASATTCVADTQCSGGQFCDELNASASGVGQCSDVDNSSTCDMTIACTSGDSVCDYVGRGLCSTTYGVCLSFSVIGEACQLDLDCGVFGTNVC